MKFVEVDFSTDIINLVLDNHKKENTLFLFPTVQSRNLALKRFQENWQFSNIKFVTFEDWKYSLFEITLLSHLMKSPYVNDVLFALNSR